MGQLKSADHSPACRESPAHCICTAALFKTGRQILAERNAAVDNARFWRRTTLILATVMAVDTILTIGKWSGWW